MKRGHGRLPNSDRTDFAVHYNLNNGFKVRVSKQLIHTGTANILARRAITYWFTEE
jgi:hypothetical protein